MKTKQTVNKKPSHPAMSNIKAILANAPRKRVGFESDIEYGYNQSGLPTIKALSIAELEDMLISAQKLDRIATQATLLKKIAALVKEVNNLSVLNGLGIAPLIAPEVMQLLMYLDRVVEQADYANTKLGRGAVIKKARAEQAIRAEEEAKAQAMEEAIAAVHGQDRANDMMNKRKVA